MNLIDGKKMAEILAVNYYSLMAWAERGWIPSYKVSRVRRFDPEQVLKWIKEGKMETARQEVLAGHRGERGREAGQ